MTPMTNQRVGASPGPEGTKETAREEAGHVKESAAGAARDVAETAKDKAGDVTTDVRQQTQQLIGQTRDQLNQQAGQQRDQAVTGLRSLGDELREMSMHGSGWGAQVARQGASWTDRAAEFLRDREPGDIVEDIRGMARRRPGRFLLGALAAGVVVGRMSRAMMGGSSDGTGSGADGGYAGTPQPAPPPPGPVGTTSPPPGPVGTTSPPPGPVGTTSPPPAEPSPVNPLGTPGTGEPGPPGTTPPGGPGQPETPGGLRRPDQPAPSAPVNQLPPQPTPTAPDPDPGAPVQPRFGPGSEQ